MMDEIERKNLYHTAWNHWGADAQLDMLIEEMAEFTQAILKTRRNGVTFSYAFFEEMADVLICLEQIEGRLKELHHGQNKADYMWTTVEHIRNQKLDRLKKRLMSSLAARYPDPRLDGDR